MIINFDSIAPKSVMNFKGGKKEVVLSIYEDDANKILRGVLSPGASIGMHTHEADSEIMYIISGKGKLINGDSDTPENAAPGTCHYCPKGCSHSLINDGETELVFFAVIPGRK